MNNFMFLDTNYLEFENFLWTGTSVITATVQYAYDNKPDRGVVLFNTTAPSFVVDLGATFTVSDFLIMNHNFATGGLYAGSTNAGPWSLVSSFSDTIGASYVESTQTGRYFRIASASVSTSGAGYFGEFIITVKKFQLNCNPNVYVPEIINQENMNTLYSGLLQSSQRGDRQFNFNAILGYDYLIGSSDSMTGTDLQNMTELSRQRATFLFWPNGNTTSQYADIYTWRPQDFYKCKMTSKTQYEPALVSSIDMIRATFNINEVV